MLSCIISSVSKSWQVTTFTFSTTSSLELYNEHGFQHQITSLMKQVLSAFALNMQLTAQTMKLLEILQQVDMLQHTMCSHMNVMLKTHKEFLEITLLIQQKDQVQLFSTTKLLTQQNAKWSLTSLHTRIKRMGLSVSAMFRNLS